MPSKIEWTEETWNPVTGCTKISPGCANCYADAMCRRFWQQWGREAPPDHFQVKLHPERLEQPFRWKKPRRVFVCSMGDLFHEDVDDHFLLHVLETMEHTPEHTYQILTKQADRMRVWINGYRDLDFATECPNIWLGVTAEAQEQWDTRTRELCKTQASIRFVSAEPLLESMDLRFGPNPNCIWCNGQGEWYADGDAGLLPVTCECMTRNRLIDWVIIGCESGPHRRTMQLDWALGLVRQCRAAGVAVFVKQLDLDGRVSKDPEEWPEELRIREYPQC